MPTPSMANRTEVRALLTVICEFIAMRFILPSKENGQNAPARRLASRMAGAF